MTLYVIPRAAAAAVPTITVAAAVAAAVVSPAPESGLLLWAWLPPLPDPPSSPLTPPSSSPRVAVQFIPGHACVAGNELADAAANTDSELPYGKCRLSFICSKSRIRAQTSVQHVVPAAGRSILGPCEGEG